MNQPRIKLLEKFKEQALHIMFSGNSSNTDYEVKELAALVYEILDKLLKNEI